MKKTTILLLLILSSCSIPYDLETRLIIKSKVIDFNGNPVINQQFNLHVKPNDPNFREEIISTSVSDENGTLKFIFPKPAIDSFSLDINKKNVSSVYLNKYLLNIQIQNFNKYEYNIEPILLVKNDEVTSLNVQYNQINQNKEIRKVEVIGGVYYNYQYINPSNEIINNEHYILPYYFSIFKNQNFELKYTVYDYATMLTEENTISLSVINDSITYIINY